MLTPFVISSNIITLNIIYMLTTAKLVCLCKFRHLLWTSDLSNWVLAILTWICNRCLKLDMSKSIFPLKSAHPIVFCISESDSQRLKSSKSSLTSLFLWYLPLSSSGILLVPASVPVHLLHLTTCGLHYCHLEATIISLLDSGQSLLTGVPLSASSLTYTVWSQCSDSLNE